MHRLCVLVFLFVFFLTACEQETSDIHVVGNRNFLVSITPVPCETDQFVCITSPEDLDKVRENLSGSYRLANDIDLASIQNWLPIGTRKDPFVGILDGNGYVIKNLTSKTEPNQYGGLLGVVKSAKITNLGLDTINLEGADHVGVLAGFSETTSVLNTYIVNVNVTASSKYVGTFFGEARRLTLIKNSYALGTISSKGDFTGGLAGFITTNGLIESSYFEGEINGADRVGGLIGGCTVANVVTSYASSTTKGRTNVGGLLGDSVGCNISDSYSNGIIVGVENVGGVIGAFVNQFDYEEWITKNVFSNTSVQGEKNVGGLLGYGDGIKIYGSYWNSDISGIKESEIGVPKTTIEFKDQRTFEGWDFEKLWYLDPQVGYPLLRGFRRELNN